MLEGKSSSNKYIIPFFNELLKIGGVVKKFRWVEIKSLIEIK